MAFKYNTAGVRDIYNHKNRWQTSRSEIPNDISKENKKILQQYFNDMEQGKNIGGSTKGQRSYTRLLTIKSRMLLLARLFQEHSNKNLTSLTVDDVHRVITKMRTGKITKQRGNGAYKSVGEYVVSLKAFWHWHMKTERRNKKVIDDITVDLDSSDDKPKFVYLDYEDVQALTDNAKGFYINLIWFLFDSGIRTGNELHNVQVKDLSLQKQGHYVLSIKDEASKTYGRDIKLLLCSDRLKRYIESQNLKSDDYLFSISSVALNKYLKRLALKVFGERSNKKPRANSYSRLTAYDFRHNSACYWLSRYKQESVLMYRFGWHSARMVHYYTEFLGMKDTITQDDILDADTQAELQTQLKQEQQNNAILQEQMLGLQKQMQDMVKRMGVYEKAVTEVKKRV